ncbi:hypothetical protein M441DRAFT_268284 [Trichoderma asperellum CBS 433.97]|uniref:Uncharacterized protein n=1 Tax=Trichoderma asperellum (strain ATCC 204424 / CBS 433.97 / NBRC 101777) TaxID=1042311 RepID=A0A2T3YVW5_TRIA4|nr:hypothetical protein M441DRAFT_268284 [Trichoderma asperellum CBS 433.97]PTB36711.1 hypothetical protein M441DRAFT_268284 [Trichoderma asperellum CBS 433.97]
MGAARSLGQPGQAHVARLASAPVETSTQGMLPARYRYLLYLCLAAVNTALVLVVSGSPACLPARVHLFMGLPIVRRSPLARRRTHTSFALDYSYGSIERHPSLSARFAHSTESQSVDRDSFKHLDGRLQRSSAGP